PIYKRLYHQSEKSSYGVPHKPPLSSVAADVAKQLLNRTLPPQFCQGVCCEKPHLVRVFVRRVPDLSIVFRGRSGRESLPNAKIHQQWVLYCRDLRGPRRLGGSN